MTRVLFVCPNLQAGGAERHWSILLPRLADRGMDVRVLTLDGRGPFYDVLEAAGVPCACARGRGGPLQTYGRAARMLIREPVDVLVSRGTSAEGLCAMRARVRPVSWAVNWHHPPGLPLARRRRAILRAVLGRADAVLAVSSSQVDELVDLGADAAAITVIPNGTDFCPAPEQRAASRFELGLATDDVAALLVGRLEAQKRVDVFIDALSTAQARAPQLIGLVAGVGPDADALAEHADAVGIRMRFLGRRDDMPSVLSAVDILCMTSDVEAAPYAVLEAMASGLPVIATRVGSLPEVIVEHQTGILVAPGATGSIARALACLADDSSGRIRMGLAGRARQVAAFSADTMAGEYASAISALAAARLSH